MKWPHKKFIQALFCSRMPIDVVAEELTKNNLPFPGPGTDMQEIYAEVKRLDPAYFYKKRKDINWENLEKTQVEPMWAYYFKKPTDSETSYLKGTFDILDNLQLRNLIFAMALSGMPPEDIELIINGKFDINVSSQSIDAFLFYFFNLKDFNYSDRKVLQDSFAKDIAAKKALKLGLMGDRNYMLWKLGAAPEKSFDQMLRDMLADSYYIFKEKAKNEPDTATKFGALAVKLADRLERVIQNDQKADDLFADIKFDIQKEEETVNIPTADDIGAEVGGKIEEYEVKKKLPDFKTMNDLEPTIPGAPLKSIDEGEYDG